jgi:hypothetical protein
VARPATPPGKKAFDTPGPVLVDVQIDYRDNQKLFETVRTTALP